MSAFTEDTAITPAGDGRWTAHVGEGWRVVRGPFGGFLAALLTRALQATTDHPPRSLSIHYVDAPEIGDVELAATVERRGRSTDAVSLRLEQGGRPMALALAVAGDWRDGEPAWLDLERPDGPGPGEATAIRRSERMPPFMGRFDIRWVGGTSMGQEGDGENVAWLSAGTPLEHALVATMADVWFPPAFARLGRPVIVPTLDLSIHFRAPLPREGEWVLARHRSDHAGGGTWISDGTLWAEDGTLLAQARQLALLRA